jgi:hypothetical protein
MSGSAAPATRSRLRPVGRTARHEIAGGPGTKERQWISTRPSELDSLAEEFTKQLQEVHVEREELAIVERLLNRLAEQVQ